MTAYEFGDIVLVPFPFTDQSAAKKRPAVVISSKAYHRDRPDLIIMAVTSQAKPVLAVGEVVVREWRQAGLLKPSVIKPVVATIEPGLVIKQLGRLNAEEQAALRQAISAVIG